jgi:hypothetical protein
MKRNYRARRAPANVRNNVRIEPCAVQIIAKSIKEGEVILDLGGATTPHRLSSLLLPAEVTSVTFEGLTYYPSKLGS